MMGHLDHVSTSVAMLPLPTIHRKAAIGLGAPVVWCVIQICLNHLGCQPHYFATLTALE